MSDLNWEDPVPTGRGAVHGWQEIADALRARPGQWARVRDGLNRNSAASIAYRIRTGAYRAFQPAGDFEAVSRMGADASAVYARYLGDGGCVVRTYDSELDEQVAMVVDLYEPAFIDATRAVTILRETLQVCPQVCAVLLRREMRRRDREVADRNAVAEREIRDLGLDDDGRWTP